MNRGSRKGLSGPRPSPRPPSAPLVIAALLLLAALVTSGVPALAGADAGITLFRIAMPDPGGPGLRPPALQGRGTEVRASSTRRSFGGPWVEVKVVAAQLELRAGTGEDASVEILRPRTADSQRAPGHAIGPARACGDDLFVAVELDGLGQQDADVRHRSELVLLRLPRGERGKAKQIGSVVGSASRGGAEEGVVFSTEIVLDETCEPWAVRTVRRWGPQVPEEGEDGRWERLAGTDALCAGAIHERTTFLRMPLQDAAEWGFEPEAPAHAVPLLMVAGADHSPSADPLPLGEIWARCGWTPVAAQVR